MCCKGLPEDAYLWPKHVATVGSSKGHISAVARAGVCVKRIARAGVSGAPDVRHILQAAAYHTILKLAGRSDTHTNIHCGYGQK